MICRTVLMQGVVVLQRRQAIFVVFADFDNQEVIAL
jgi:hypothetical protein